MKEFMREIAVSISNDIKATMKESMKTTNNEHQISLTSNSLPELITQDTQQPSSRVSKLTDIIEEMDIEKKTMGEKHQHLTMKIRTKKSKK